MVHCKHGRLASPVRERGSVRHCKLPKKSASGRKRDRKTNSGEFHERRYRRDKRAGRR